MADNKKLVAPDRRTIGLPRGPDRGLPRLNNVGMEDPLEYETPFGQALDAQPTLSEIMGEGTGAAGGEDGEVLFSFRPDPDYEPPAPPEEKQPWYERYARGAGARTLEALIGGTLEFAGETGEQLRDALPESLKGGGFVPDGDALLGFRYANAEEYDELSKDVQGNDLLRGAAEVARIGAENLNYKPGVTWEQVKESAGNDEDGLLTTATKILSFGIEQGTVSLPDMVAAVRNLPAYIQARAGEIAKNRAVADGRDQVSGEDLMWGAGTSVIASSLERLGADAVLGRLIPKGAAPGTKLGVAARGGTGLVGEAGTEAVQEAVEYTGTQADTKAGFHVEQMLDQALAGAVGGGVFGGVAGTLGGTVDALRSPTTPPPSTDTQAPDTTAPTVPPTAPPTDTGPTDSEFADIPQPEAAPKANAKPKAKPKPAAKPKPVATPKPQEASAEPAPAPVEPGPEPVSAPETPAAEPINEPEAPATKYFDKKETEKKLRAFREADGQGFNAIRSQGIKPLFDAIRNRYPDLDIPKTGGTIGPPRIAAVFDWLNDLAQENFPNLGEFVDELVGVDSSAAAIRALNKMQSAVERGEAEVTGEGGVVSDQVAKVISDARSTFNAAETGRRTEANVRSQLGAIADIATATRELYLEADKQGLTEQLPQSNFARLDELAKYGELSPNPKKTAKGRATKAWPVPVQRKRLRKLFDTLSTELEAAQQVLASQDNPIAPKRPALKIEQEPKVSAKRQRARDAVAKLKKTTDEMRKNTEKLSPKITAEVKKVSKKRSEKKVKAEKAPARKKKAEKGVVLGKAGEKGPEPAPKKGVVLGTAGETKPKKVAKPVFEEKKVTLRGRGMVGFLESAGIEVAEGTTAADVRENISPKFNTESMQRVSGLREQLTTGDELKLTKAVKQVAEAKDGEAALNAVSKLDEVLEEGLSGEVPRATRAAVNELALERFTAAEARRVADETSEADAELAALIATQEAGTDPFAEEVDDLAELAGLGYATRSFDPSTVDPNDPNYDPDLDFGRIRDEAKGTSALRQMDGKTISLSAALKAVRTRIPKNSTLDSIIAKLLALDLNVPVTLGSLGREGYAGVYHTVENSIELGDPGSMSDFLLTTTLVHEAVHAATVLRLRSDPDVRADMREMLEQAKRAAKVKDDYAFDSVYEFVAEAFSNVRFQEFLQNVPSKEQTLFERFVNAIRKLIGLGDSEPELSMMDELVNMADSLFMLQTEYAGRTDRFARERGLGSFARTREVNLNDQLTPSYNVMSRLREAARKPATAINLGFMNNDVMERKFRDLFSRAAAATLEGDAAETNPLSRYLNAKQKAEAFADPLERRTNEVAKKVEALESGDRSRLYLLMRNSTMFGLNADLPTNHESNMHLWNTKRVGKGRKQRVKYLKKDKKEKARELREAYGTLSKEAKEAYREMRELTKETFESKRFLALELLGKSFGLESEDAAALQTVRTKADIQEFMNRGLFDNDATAAAFVRSAERIVSLGQVKGPYFPLRRYGEFVVKPVDSDDSDKYVSFHTSEAQANAEAEKQRKAGRSVFVTMKIKAEAHSADMAAVTSQILSKVKDAPTKARLNAALVEAFAENAAYASQLKRKNFEGVKPEEMGKGFREYMQVSKYAMGDMATSYDIEQAMTDLKKLQSRTAVENELSQAEQIMIGKVRNELAVRNQEDASHRTLSPMQKTIGTVGFFNFLGAPSYWMLNATQTYVVTTPYLTAKYGARSPAALVNAQRRVMRAATRMFRKHRTFDRDLFLNELGPQDRALVDRMIEDGHLQSTLSHEFGLLLQPETWSRGPDKAFQKFKQVFQAPPEGVEYFNRISTAAAAYHLSGGDYQAAVDAMNETQFNYSTVNRARLLKSLPQFATGGGRAVVTPVMMFKTFGIGMARLLYGNIGKVVSTGKTADGKYRVTKKQRWESFKIAVGLMASHSMFGGLGAGLLLEPIRLLANAINLALDDEDEFDVQKALDEIVADYVESPEIQRAIQRGWPALFGIDMSQSISLANLFFMGRDDIDLADRFGPAAAAFNLLGPVAQYGGRALQESARMINGTGDLAKWLEALAKWLEAIVPLKVYRGVSKGIRANESGLETSYGTSFMSPEETSVWTAVRSGMGFRDAPMAARQDKYYGDAAEERMWGDKRGKLLRDYYDAKTPEKRAGVIEEIREYNERVPDKTTVITRSTLIQSATRRAKDRAEVAHKYYGST